MIQRSIQAEETKVNERDHKYGSWTLSTPHELTTIQKEGGLGYLPTLTFTTACSLLLVAIADTAARNDAAWAEPLFWAALVMLFAPLALRLATPAPSRQERLGIVVVLGMALYVVKVLNSPLFFTYSDEFMHWRTANDIIRTGTLFQPNPLLPVSPLYPGLEITTTTLANLSGLTIFQSGIIILGAARLVLLLALYLFYEQVSRSDRIASIAALLYLANPNFLFFDAQFSYESLALPLTLLTLFAIARRSRIQDVSNVGLTFVALVGLGAVLVTHHMTSYALAALLILWTLIHIDKAHHLHTTRALYMFIRWYAGEVSTKHLFRSSWRHCFMFVKGLGGQLGDGVGRLNPGTFALLAIIGIVTWVVYIASQTIPYLAPVLGRAVVDVIRLIAGEEIPRQLFRTFSGHVAPLQERITAFASVGCVLFGMPFGLIRIWWSRRTDGLAVTLAVASLSYPASLALRFVQSGSEVSNRASEFVFLPLAFVLAVGATELWLPNGTSLKRSTVFATWASIIFAGSVIIGWAPWARLPGPYLVTADPRSIEPQGDAMAQWARDYLGPNNRFAGDRTSRQRLASYGEQYTVTGYGDNVNTALVFFSLQLGQDELGLLQQGKIHYLAVDRRMSTGLPMTGYYFEQGEPLSFQRTTPLDPRALAKFDHIDQVSRLYDSGSLQIYDVGVLSGVR